MIYIYDGMERRRPSVSKELTTIKEQLERSKWSGDLRIKRKLQAQFPRVPVDIVEAIARFYPTEDSSVARSESLVDENEITLLNQKVDRIRNWLFSTQKNFKEHPDCQEYIEEGFRTSDEIEKLYWFENGNLSMYADKRQTSKESNNGHKLSFFLDEKGKDIDITLGFENNFELEIEFDFDDKQKINNNQGPRKTLHYGFHGQLKDMTKEEHVIINHYLSGIIKQHIEKPQ